MLVQLEGIYKHFFVKQGLFAPGSRVQAVDGVDLEVYEGENLGLVGESGSGKTTLGRIIVQLYKADRGKVAIKGVDVRRAKTKTRQVVAQSVQMVFQDPYSSLDPRFTARGILLEAIKQGEAKGEPEAERKMIEILRLVGLPDDSLNRFPHEFSGGERQRLAIARSLLMNPKLLILDEAVSSLDVLIQEQIITLLKDLQKRYAVTYLFITHNLRVVRKLCQRIAVMYQGRIVEIAETEELFVNPQHVYTKALLSAAVEYQAPEKETEILITENSRLMDLGNNHFVID